jgi:hypothetical protein
MEPFKSSLHRLLSYMESESYRGFDPYDGLSSPIIQIAFKKNKFLRFGIQQLVKRSPINLRPILNIKKGFNPVTLGLCIQAYSNLMEIFPENGPLYEERIKYLIKELIPLIAPGYHGACWGYDFPWQARHAAIPALKPNIVATGIITHALYKYYKKSGSTEARDLCINAADFVLLDLQRSFDHETFCFSYSPFDSQQVYNASAKGIRLLSEVFSISGEKTIEPIARQAASYIIKRQRADGSWHYSETGKWIDNYHTGYVLDCLLDYSECMGDTSIQNCLNKGFEFYQNAFFTADGIPKLFPDKKFPIDSTAAGQSLSTLSKFHDLPTAIKVANWMIANMQSPEGYYYYRKNKIYTIKTSFMRWNNAWMLAGLSELLQKKKSE